MKKESIRQCCYRPYCKQWLYFDKNFNERPGQTLKLFPNETIENLVIITTGVGSQKDVSVLITNTITDYHFQHNGQCFPLYTHEKQEKTDQTSLFTETEGYTRKENIPNSILTDFQIPTPIALLPKRISSITFTASYTAQNTNNGLRRT
ncbi:hypothetical protein EZJ55_00700 [Microcystis aeruginosa EAWAG127a]|uniref:Type ISP restriction-modification enzyme LLaBIII C-terminal specificity domain-containing protein n=1 Tax=Microcystis aeruginosa EAWAG127a TaxID=2529855 RepID=A0A5J5M2B2_MICAE|nr:hypothetical protein EZJ55_00700 [Microcystis aeruginosa EAWAG127a]